MQTPPGSEDSNERTSEGLLVFGSGRGTSFDDVAGLTPGVLARAEGVVTEFNNRDGLTVTEVVVQGVEGVAVCDSASYPQRLVRVLCTAHRPAVLTRSVGLSKGHWWLAWAAGAAWGSPRDSHHGYARLRPAAACRTVACSECALWQM